MRKNTLNKLLSAVGMRPLLLCCLTLLVVACKPKKNLIKTGKITDITSLSKKRLLDSISENQSDFKTLNIKAKANLDISSKSYDVGMNLRIRKNEAIWVSVSMFGIEGARALITPDSIKVLNRLQSTYTVKPFSFIYNYASKQVNFQTLQSILVGNCIGEFINPSSTINTNESGINLAGMLQDLAYSANLNTRFKVTQTKIADNTASQELRVDYNDYSPEGALFFPHTVNIHSGAESHTVAIGLSYNRVIINEPVDLPFSVPQRFTTVN